MVIIFCRTFTITIIKNNVVMWLIILIVRGTSHLDAPGILGSALKIDINILLRYLYSVSYISFKMYVIFESFIYQNPLMPKLFHCDVFWPCMFSNLHNVKFMAVSTSSFMIVGLVKLHYSYFTSISFLSLSKSSCVYSRIFSWCMTKSYLDLGSKSLVLLNLI